MHVKWLANKEFENGCIHQRSLKLCLNTEVWVTERMGMPAHSICMVEE